MQTISMIEIISAATAVVSMIGAAASLLYAKRAKKAEVNTVELNNADRFLEMVEKAYQKTDDARKARVEVLIKTIEEERKQHALQIEEYNKQQKTNAEENQKLAKAVNNLEAAIRQISNCPYRHECPVTAKLQGSAANH